MQRGLKALRSRVVVSRLPEWFFELDFTSACHAADPWVVGQFVLELRAAERQLRLSSSTRNNVQWAPQQTEEDMTALPPWAADDDDAQRRMVVALGRMALGAAVEAAFAEAALDCCAPGARGTESDAATARVYQDAFLVAVWTSAHAQYVSSVQFGVEEPPPPSLHSVPNAATELDLSDLFARRTCQRACPKKATALLQILCRCTNPGARGWDTLLDSALQESMATRSVVNGSLLVALSALHPYLHPALRPPWNLRMRALRVAAHRLTDSEARTQLVATAAATKEAVRRLLATVVAAVPATQAALAHVHHPVGLLTSPPMRMPHRGMEGAMAMFVNAGVAMAMSDVGYADAVHRFFRPASTEGCDRSGGIEWDARWLGRGTSAAHQKVSLVSVSSELWATAFRANFLVYWAHCMSNQIRASRLDSVQHRALHSLNAATALTLKLPEEKQLRAQRAALQHVCAGLLTIEEAASTMGIQGVHGTSSNGGTKGSQDTLRALSSAGSMAAAELLIFARTAWVAEELLIVDLGAETTRLQLRALYRRLGRSDYNEATACANNLPVHTTALHACIECRRVANAFASESSKPNQSFNELGCSSSMLCTVCTGPEKGKTHICCAKRSSAALRTAVTFEETMTEKCVEALPMDAQAVRTLLGENNGAASGRAAAAEGVAARVRRDAKNSLEQRALALACGEQPMLCVPIVCRAVRLWNEWYALCSWCGAMLHVGPHNRYGSEICCCKCDAQMLGMQAPTPAERKASVCRYCTSEDNVRSASRWKTVKAPLDLAGENVRLPPPLRTVTYCPQHWRSWLAAAHRVLPTRVILSHIAHNAKPIFSYDKSRTSDELGYDAPTRVRKRRRGGAKPAADADL